jgi:hypothetical protein
MATNKFSRCTVFHKKPIIQDRLQSPESTGFKKTVKFSRLTPLKRVCRLEFLENLFASNQTKEADAEEADCCRLRYHHCCFIGAGVVTKY